MYKIISKGDELEDLYFPSQESFYEEIEDDIFKLKRFGDLCWSYEREVDKPFADSYEVLLEKLSQIKTEDIKIKNNLGITEKEVYFINSSTVGQRDKIKDEISFEDVLGYGGIGDIIKADYGAYISSLESGETSLTLDSYISARVRNGEFDYDIIPEWQEFLSLGIDCVPLIGDAKGILEGVIGVDIVTGRELSSLERGLSFLSVIPIIGDYKTIVKGAQRVVVKEVAEGAAKNLVGVGLKKYALKEGGKYAINAFNKEFLRNSLTMVGSNALTGFGVNPVACLLLYQGGRITLKNWKKVQKVFGNIDGVREAGGLRQSALKELTPDEIKYIKNEFSEIGGDPNKLRFNKGSSTSYRDDIDAINIRGDIFPDLNEIHPRSVMSERAVLAHEYYGHAANRGTTARIGSWNDEFRASYMAAKNAPNLSEIDRYHLIQDAISRAQEAGVSIRPNEYMRGILYGY